MSHKGLLVFANNLPEPISYKANGKITNAFVPFEMCMERIVHSRGTVFFATNPFTCVGVMRIN